MLLKFKNKKSGFIPLETPSRKLNEQSNIKELCRRKSLTGFTLLEILLVVGIISVLAGIVIVAINPGRQLAQVRNTQRKSDIKQIDSALTQYYIDNNNYPNTVLGSLTEICDTGEETTGHSITCTNLVDLSALVPTYLTAIPVDPQATTTNGAGYRIIKDATTSKIGISATAELNETVTIGVLPAVSEEEEDYSCGDPTSADCWSTQSPSDLAWSTESIYIVTGAQSNTNGSANTLALVALAGSYPAAEYCYNLTEGGVPVGT